MPIKVNLPDGSFVNFPDGTPDDEMVSAIKRFTFAKNPQPAPEQFNPTDGMSSGDRFVAGTGSALVNTGMGLKQLGLQAGNKLGFVDDSTVANYQSQIDDERKLQAPLMDTTAGTVGNIAGNVGLFAAGGSALAPFKVAQGAGWLARGGNAIANGVVGGGVLASTQPVGSGETRAGNIQQGAQYGAIGGAGGHVLGSVAGRVAKGASDKLSPMVRELYEKARAAGIDVMPHQLFDSRIVKWLASVTKDIPFTGAAKANARQVDQFTKAVSKSIGQNTDEISPQVLNNAKNVIGKMYDDAFSGTTVKIDGKAATEYQALRNGLDSRLTTEQQRQFDALMSKVGSNINNGKLDGKVYQELRKELKSIQAENPNAYGNVVKEFQSIFDGSASRSLPADKIGLRQTADRLYRNKKVVDKSMSRADTMDVKTATEGKVNPATFKSAQGSKYNPTPEIDTLGRIGQMIKDPAPNSGTMPRQLIGAGLLGAGGAASPIGVIGGLGLGATVGRVVNSPMAGRYVAEGMPKVIQGAARQIEQKLPGLLAPAMAGSAMLSAPMMSPEQFDAKLNADLKQGRISKAQAASQLDAYLQTIKGRQGIESVREIYKQFPNWSGIYDN